MAPLSRDNRVLVAAPEPLVQAGIQEALRTEFTVIGVVDSLQAARRLLREQRPVLSVLMLRPLLRETSFDQACTELIAKFPSTAALVLLYQPRLGDVPVAYRSGARGVFEACTRPQQLRDALLQICSGELAIQPSLIPRLCESQHEAQPASGVLSALTERELTLLRLLAWGNSSKDIATKLGTTPRAVDRVVERLLEHLGASTRAQAVYLATRGGLIL